jgi:hypothetical protein
MTTDHIAPLAPRDNSLAFHPIADLFPLMEGVDFDALVTDIRANGLNTPIWLYEDLILDGRNRYRACAEADVEPDFQYFSGSHADAVAFVISANIHRRHLHLTTEQKRELIGELLKANPQASDRQTGKVIGADNKTVASVRAEKEAREEIPHVSKRTDTKGRKQPARKPAATKSDAPRKPVVSEVQRAANKAGKASTAAALLKPAKLSADAFLAASHKKQEAFLDEIGADHLLGGMSGAMRDLLLENLRRTRARAKTKQLPVIEELEALDEPTGKPN